MKTSNFFIKKNQTIDINFYLYVDNNIAIFYHGQKEELVKSTLDKYNKFLKYRYNTLKGLKEDKKKNDDDDLPEEYEIEDDLMIDFDNIDNALKESKGSLTYESGIPQVVFNPDNLFEIKLKVKEPNHDEVSRMIAASTILSPSLDASTNQPSMQIDLNRYNDIRVKELLREWNFEDETGKAIPLTNENINILHPKVFTAIVFYINLNIGLYLDNFM